jgi:hypothetical protein
MASNEPPLVLNMGPPLLEMERETVAAVRLLLRVSRASRRIEKGDFMTDQR